MPMLTHYYAIIFFFAPLPPLFEFTTSFIAIDAYAFDGFSLMLIFR